MALLQRDQISEALRRLDAELGRRGVRAELFLVGGAVMCLAHESRPSTSDVAGWFTEPQVVRSAAEVVARDLGLDPDWLNDAAKGFIPEGAGFELWRALDHLSVSVADPRTLLAMKAAAARSDLDRADIRYLADILALHSASDVLAVVTTYFAEERLPPRTRLMLEEMFDDGP
jgi:hypothetical protein